MHLGGCDAALPAGCTHVVTLWDDGQEPPALNVGEGGADAPQRAVFPVRDSHDADISQHFEGCCAFLTECAEAGGIAFVHCQMGRSRSATATIAFLMHRYRLPLLAAYGHVAALRNISALNYGFLARLTDAELRLAAGAGAGEPRPTLPLPLYFHLLERVSSPHPQVRDASRADIVAEWKRQRQLDAAERRAGPFFGRLVYNLRYVAADIAASSEHCAAVLRVMDGAAPEAAAAAPAAWGAA